MAKKISHRPVFGKRLTFLQISGIVQRALLVALRALRALLVLHGLLIDSVKPVLKLY